ncbi:MAG: transglutaminase family protein [Verrucomicrobiota bacterium]
MKLRVLHRTTYRYARPAYDSFNEVRLQPIEHHWQKRLSYDLRSNPISARGGYLDLYLNAVDVLEYTQPHETLEIEAESTVETTTRTLPGPEDPAGLNDPAYALQLHDFLVDSHYVQLSPDLWRQAVDCLPNGVTDLWQDSVTLSHWIYDHFEYAPGSTHAHTTVNEALSKRQGVCQDFAHVLLGLCRSLKIPARYVSGYFFNEEFDPSQGGSEASHAWVEIFLPTVGWYGIDPTHRRPVDERYISIAVGRDYADIRPVSGTYRGAPERTMEIFVRVSQDLPTNA